MKAAVYDKLGGPEVIRYEEVPDPSVRKGGDTGMPVALAGRGSALGGAFYEVADKVIAAAEKVGNEDVIEIS